LKQNWDVKNLDPNHHFFINILLLFFLSQISYIVVLTLVFTRILSVASDNGTAAELHPKVYALGLIVIWLRFMRSCRVFQTLGPFIAILGKNECNNMLHFLCCRS